MVWTIQGPRPNSQGVDLVVVDHRTPDSARRALALDHPRIQSRTWVFNPGPAPEPIPEGIRVLSTEENLGFAEAANRGARSGKADRILFLNPDCELSPEAFEALLLCLDHNPELAAVGPNLQGEDRGFRRPGGRDPASWPRIWDSGPSPAGDVDWVAGTALLVRRADFDALGGFDPSYFLYLEDVDLGRRLRSRSRGCRVLPEVFAVHTGGQSFPDTRSQKAAYRTSRRLYMRRHASRLLRLLWECKQVLDQGLGAFPPRSPF